MKNLFGFIFLLSFITSCTIHQHYSFPKTTKTIKDLDEPDPVFDSAILLRTGKSSASGVIIKIDNNKTAWALSAKHFCIKVKNKVEAYASPHKSENVIKFDASVEKMHSFLDLCILKLNGDTTSVKPLQLMTKNLYSGMRVHTIGAPAGLWPSKSTGYVVGFAKSNHAPSNYKIFDIIIVSISSFYGSSGCPIYNDDRELVGIIVAVNKKYHHNSLGIPPLPIKNFLNSFFKNR